MVDTIKDVDGNFVFQQDIALFWRILHLTQSNCYSAEFPNVFSWARNGTELNFNNNDTASHTAALTWVVSYET